MLKLSEKISFERIKLHCLLFLWRQIFFIWRQFRFGFLVSLLCAILLCCSLMFRLEPFVVVLLLEFVSLSNRFVHGRVFASRSDVRCRHGLSCSVSTKHFLRISFFCNIPDAVCRECTHWTLSVRCIRDRIPLCIWYNTRCYCIRQVYAGAYQAVRGIGALAVFMLRLHKPDVYISLM